MKSLKKILLGLLLIGVSINLDLDAMKRGRIYVNEDVYVDDTGLTCDDGRRSFRLPGEESSSDEEEGYSVEDSSSEEEGRSARKVARRRVNQTASDGLISESDEEGGLEAPDQVGEDQELGVGSDAEMPQADEALVSEDEEDPVYDSDPDNSRLLERIYQRRDSAARRIQAVVRGWKARRRVRQAGLDQQAYEDFLVAERERDVARIQAIFRGRQARRALAQAAQEREYDRIGLQALLDYEAGLAAIAANPGAGRWLELPTGLKLSDLAAYLPTDKAVNGALVVLTGSHLIGAYLPLGGLFNPVIITAMVAHKCAYLYLEYRGGKWVLNNPNVRRFVRARRENLAQAAVPLTQAVTSGASYLRNIFAVR